MVGSSSSTESWIRRAVRDRIESADDVVHAVLRADLFGFECGQAGLLRNDQHYPRPSGVM